MQSSSVINIYLRVKYTGGPLTFDEVSSRFINFETAFFGPLTFVLCHLSPSTLTLAFLVHELLKWCTAGPRMHTRTSAFCVGGAMPALAAAARLRGMHVCFPRMHDRVSAFRPGHFQED